MYKMKDLNRIKVVLAERKKTNKWLAAELGKDPEPCQSGAQIHLNRNFLL